MRCSTALGVLAMYIAVPRESAPGEHRVAVTPDGVTALVGLGHQVGIESGAGADAQFPDPAYAAAGAEVARRGADLLRRADVVLTVRGPSEAQLEQGAGGARPVAPGPVLIGLLDPLRRPERIARLASRGASLFSLDLMPRIARAQPMDALSAMSTVSGYRAAVVGAALCGRFFPLLMTAAGTERPARVLVLGAGVAGLQAIATARRLGAVVQAFDTRPAARQQVESLGAAFLSLPLPAAAPEPAGGYAIRLAEEEQARERALIADAVRQADVVITTALVPDGPAPVLVTRDMALSMHPGAVLVDLAAESGGNCAATVFGERIVLGGVVIEGSCGPWDMPFAASRLYSRNAVAFLHHLCEMGLACERAAQRLAAPDWGDRIVRETCLTWEGKVVHRAVAERLGQDSPRAHPCPVA